jgi:formamidopyrimidine-DNA glycosylase
MVEAPKLRIIYNTLKKYKNSKIKLNIKKDKYLFLENKIIKDIDFIGKHLWLYLDIGYVRIHFMMYGRIIVNKIYKNKAPQLSLIIDKDIINFYSSSIKYYDNEKNMLENKVGENKIDITHKLYNIDYHKKLVNINKTKYNNYLLCDFVLMQELFPGVGNILKNEALYRCKLDPFNKVKNIKKKDINCIIDNLHKVALNMYKLEKNITEDNFSVIWKQVRDNIFHIYFKKMCPSNHKVKIKWCGDKDRKTYYCDICQK